MSSMSSGCDHVDHVRTQLPYALTVETEAWETLKDGSHKVTAMIIIELF